MPFLYETHMHTCLASACGVSTGKEHAQFYKDAGYTGIIMTDHFFRGNTAVPRNLPDWKERRRELNRLSAQMPDAFSRLS